MLFDATVDSGLGAPAAFETLEELCGSEIPAVSNLGSISARCGRAARRSIQIT